MICYTPLLCKGTALSRAESVPRQRGTAADYASQTDLDSPPLYTESPELVFRCARKVSDSHKTPSRPCARSRRAPSDAASSKSASGIQSRCTLRVCLPRVDGCAHAPGGGTPEGTISCSWCTCVVSTRRNLGKQRVRMHHDIPLPYVNAHAWQVWKACMILCSPHDCSNNAFCMVFPTLTDAHILNDIFTILSGVLASASPLLT